MATPTQFETVPVSAAPADDSSYVDWPAILAGAIAAAAISLVMLTFGSAIGFSLTDPFGREGVSLFWLAIALTIWLVWVQVSAFMVGGYITGRMRRRKHDATEHEVDVRDGIHGLLVWGTGVVISALLAFGGIGALAQGLGSAAAPVAGAAATEIAEADPFEGTIDLLFRAPQAAGEDTTAARAEAGRILIAGTLEGDVSAEDRAYLAELTAVRTGLAPAEAEARVDTVVAEAQRVRAETIAAANQARRISILVAFITAASLAVSAAGAWFAAGMGGSHRDKNTVVPFFNRTRHV